MTSSWDKYLPPPPAWTVDDVYIMNSDRERGREAVDEVRRVSESIYMLSLDMSDLRSVWRMVDEFMRKEPRLHVVVNNDYDLQFGVNALGNFYLTQFLLPVLVATAKATAWTTRQLMNGPVRRRCTPAQLYRRSKLASLLFALELGWTGDRFQIPLRSTRETSTPASRDIPAGPGSERQCRSVSLLSMRSDRDRRACGIMNVRSHDVSRGVIAPLFAATSLLNGKVPSCAVGRARVGNILESILEHCAQVHLRAWLEAPAQMDCFERMNHAASSSGVEDSVFIGACMTVFQEEGLLGR
ncbi:hypothetical protein V8D89_001000 [Ganoderma adspersum]